MTLPNFFIVGAARSGTTSIFNGLGQHPQIFVSPRKEPKFFCERRPAGVESLSEYESLFGGAADEIAVGEASPQYLYDSGAPRRIHEVVPDARVIIVLRNPVDMAHSLWRMMSKSLALEPLDFEQALRAEPARRVDPSFARANQEFHINFYYADRARYYAQVKRYLEVFDRDQVQIELFEDFVREPAETYRRLFEHLNVDPAFQPDLRVRGEATQLRSESLQRALMGLYPAVSAVHRKLPPSVRNPVWFGMRRLYRMNLRPERPVRVDPELRRRLAREFQEDIAELESLLDLDLSVWRAERP